MEKKLSKMRKLGLVTVVLITVLFTPVFASYTGQTGTADQVYNRASDWAGTSHVVGTTGHGNWSYHMMLKSDVDAYGRGDSNYWTGCEYHATISDLGSVGAYRFYSPMPAMADLEAYEDHVGAMWNKQTNDYLDYRESEITVVFTAPQSGLYNVLGDLYWSNELVTDPRSYVHIGTLQSGVYTNLWTSIMLRDSDYAAPIEGMVDPANPLAVPGFTNNSDLLGIDLAAGDQLLITLQTGVLNYRKTNIHDSDVYIEYVPEPATFGLIGLGFVLLRKRS